MDRRKNMSPAEAERLSKIVDDLNGVQQAIKDISLYGYESTSADTQITNREMLAMRVAIFQCSLGLIIGSKDIDPARVQFYIDKHMESMNSWLHFHKDVANDLVAEKENTDKSLGDNVVRLFGRNGKNEQRSLNH